MKALFTVSMIPLLLLAAEPEDGASLPPWTGLEFIHAETTRKMVKLYDATSGKARPAIETELNEIQRELNLDEARLKVLRLAAEGAIEQAGRNVRGSIMSGVERRAKGATAATIKKVLNGINSSWSTNSAVSQSVWRSALTQVLTNEERKKLETVREERKQYRERALALLLEQYVIEGVGLAESQMAKLRPLLAKVVKDYLPDMSNYYNDGDENSVYSEMVPVMVLGVDEKIAKEIIPDKTQWERWEMMPGQYRESWSWIKRNHDSRVKREAEKK